MLRFEFRNELFLRRAWGWGYDFREEFFLRAGFLGLGKIHSLRALIACPQRLEASS